MKDYTELQCYYWKNIQSITKTQYIVLFATSTVRQHFFYPLDEQTLKILVYPPDLYYTQCENRMTYIYHTLIWCAKNELRSIL